MKTKYVVHEVGTVILVVKIFRWGRKKRPALFQFPPFKFNFEKLI